MNLPKNNDHPLIDVRTSEEFQAGHIPGAVNIPLDQIEKTDIESGSNLYCRSGRRSGIAQKLLKEKGISTNNLGGIEDYDGPIEK